MININISYYILGVRMENDHYFFCQLMRMHRRSSRVGSTATAQLGRRYDGVAGARSNKLDAASSRSLVPLVCSATKEVTGRGGGPVWLPCRWEEDGDTEWQPYARVGDGGSDWRPKGWDNVRGVERRVEKAAEGGRRRLFWSGLSLLQ